jgi:hypothetical protein
LSATHHLANRLHKNNSKHACSPYRLTILQGESFGLTFYKNSWIVHSWWKVSYTVLKKKVLFIHTTSRWIFSSHHFTIPTFLYTQNSIQRLLYYHNSGQNKYSMYCCVSSGCELINQRYCVSSAISDQSWGRETPWMNPLRKWEGLQGSPAIQNGPLTLKPRGMEGAFQKSPNS